MKKLFVALSVSLALFSSCSTDFDIIGPYKDNTIVFGLLDKNESIHFIKVNKSFLGTGNAYDYAAIKDSSEYALVSGNVEAWNSGTLVASYPLQDTTITNRDSGAFYYPEQTMYYFIATLNQNYEYRLNLNINDGAKEVSGSTKLVYDFPLNTLTGNTLYPFSLAYNNSSLVNNYPDYYIRFTPGINTRRIDTWVHFWYDEYTASGTTRKKIEWKIDSYITSSTAGTEPERVAVFAGDAFYRYIKLKIPSNANVIKRVARQMDIQFVAVSDDMYTYMKVNEPSTGIVQERPSFTNLSNAIGIFSSRYTKWVRGKVLNKDSQKELCTGQYTYDLLFCTDSLPWSTETYYCP